MTTEIKYTKRVTMGPDGMYRWKSPVRLASDKEDYKIPLVVCVVVCVFSIVLCAVISVDFMISVLPAILGSVAAAILFVFLMIKLSTGFSQKYEMNDSCVKIADPKVPVAYQFDAIREIVVHSLYLELRDPDNSSRIYTAKEDFYFVKDYIVGHTLGKAVVTYGKGMLQNTEDE